MKNLTTKAQSSADYLFRAFVIFVLFCEDATKILNRTFNRACEQLFFRRVKFTQDA